MLHASIPLLYWDEIFASIVFLINRLPSSSQHIIPFQTLFNKPPDFSLLRVLGCLCFPYTRPYNSHKLEPRSLPCVFIGYAHPTKGYKCLHLPSNKIVVSRHVIFNEQRFPFKEVTITDVASSEHHTYSPFLWATSAQQVSAPTFTTPAPTAQGLPSSDRLHRSAPDRTSARAPDPLSAHAPPSFSTADHASFPTDRPLPSPSPSPDITSSPFIPISSTQTSSVHPMVTRSRDNTRIPKLFPEFETYSATSSIETEPTSFKQAYALPQWRSTMAREIDALATNQTWSLVPPPTDANIVGCKWDFKIKRKANGSIDRYKARLVAKGYSQEEGIDYFDTYSPVVRPTTIRLILSIALSFHWDIQQLDVQNAFLHGNLNELVYMHQPPGFSDPRLPNHVCKLSKALYGFKQSPRAWFQTLSQALVHYGFHASQFDPSLFVFHHDAVTLVLLVYVDDIVLTGSCHTSLSNLISYLQTQFAIKTLGSLSYFLGIEVQRTSTGLHLSQTKYVHDLLLKCNMHKSKPCLSLMDTHLSLSKFDSPPMDNPPLYRMIVGALQYVIITRPDISFAVNKASQFMHSPTLNHWTTVKRILRYLNGSATLGLHLQHSTSLQLHAYSDAD